VSAEQKWKRDMRVGVREGVPRGISEPESRCVKGSAEANSGRKGVRENGRDRRGCHPLTLNPTFRLRRRDVP